MPRHFPHRFAVKISSFDCKESDATLIGLLFLSVISLFFSIACTFTLNISILLTSSLKCFILT